MATVAVLHHLEEASSGHAGVILRANGLELDERDLPRGDPLPDLGAVDGVLSLGGRQSLREIDSYPYLLAERDLVRAAVEGEKPFLGVCLGGQLLAAACGGEVKRLERRAIGWSTVRRTGAAEGDPLFGPLPPELPVLHWNEDRFGVPDGATELLSRSAEGGEAIRVGPSAWGIQFHPEADPVLLDEWYRRGAGSLADAGVTEPEARAADTANMTAQRRNAEILFGAFARLVVDNCQAPRAGASRGPVSRGGGRGRSRRSHSAREP
jgi:GMP synthase (glutamine-hydrolysing)